MITLKHSRRRASYSDNGNESLDRNPNRDHPARSHGTTGFSAMGIMAATGVAGLGLSAYNSYQMGKGGGGSMPPPRDLNGELNGIAGAIPGFNQAGLNNQLQNSGAVTANNQNNYNNLLRGSFNTSAYNTANPGVLDEFNKQQAAGGLQNWSFADFAAANAGLGSNDPSLNQYYTNGLGSQMRSGWDAANPQLAAYNQTLGDQVNRINAQGPASYNAQGYAASGSGNQGPVGTSLAAFNPQMASQAYANAATANQNYAGAQTANLNQANGGPLMGGLNQSAAYNLDRVSGLQAQQQGIASNLLGAGGGLTQGELMGAQDSARAAYADRGMVRSNNGIGAEILQTDAAQRNRLMSNLGIAQGVDAAGQAQLGANRGFALGVQGQGQNLAQSNTGQANSLAQFNAGLLTNTSQFNAGQGNALGQFNAGLLTNNNQFNAGQGNALSQFNAGLLTNNNQFNAGQGNALSQFNAGLLTNNSQFNAGQGNDLGKFNAGLLTNNNQFNAGQGNALGQFNAGLLTNNNQFNAGQGNSLNQFNAGLLTNNSQFNAGQGNALSQFNAGQFNNVGLNLANNNADRQNQMGQFNANLLQNNNQFNAGQVNNAGQFNASASNQAGATNAGLAQSYQNDAYNRSAGYGNFLLGQAQNPNAMALNLMGNAPDYTTAMLGYGQDLYNTNYNGGVSAANSARNNSAAMTGAGLNLLGSGMNAYANYAGMQSRYPGGGGGGGPFGGGSSYG